MLNLMGCFFLSGHVEWCSRHKCLNVFSLQSVAQTKGSEETSSHLLYFLFQALGHFSTANPSDK